MKNLFRQEVTGKRQKLEGTVLLILPPLIKALVGLVALFIITSLFFLFSQDYARKEKVFGVLQPDKGVLPLYASHSGDIIEILVDEGQKISSGQPLLRFSSKQYTPNEMEFNQYLMTGRKTQLNKLKEQISILSRQFDLQKNSLLLSMKHDNKKLNQLKIQEKLFTNRLDINQEIKSQLASLAETGYTSQLELKRQEDSIISIEFQLESIEIEKLQLLEKLDQTNNELAKLSIEKEQALSLLENQLIDLEQDIAQLKLVLSGEVRATQDGVVSGITVNLGEQIKLGQKLMEILPTDGKLEAVIYAPTDAYAFVEKGQRVNIRFHAFPYQKFGIHHGVIEELSSNVLLPSDTRFPTLISEPAYRIKVQLESQSIHAYGNDIPLKAGMKLDADIIVDNRSLIEWLFEPLYSLQGSI